MEVHCPDLCTKPMLKFIYSMYLKWYLIDNKKLIFKKKHGCGDISIIMTKICGESVALPLKSIFEIALKEKKFRIFEK